MHAQSINARQVRPVYCGPPDVLRRIGVGIRAVAATGAAEPRLAFAVVFIDVPARCAGARGIAGIDKSDRDASTPSLVDHKALKLAKSPGMQTGPLRFVSPCPATDGLEVFKGNSASGAFGNGDNFFGNLMVNGARESLFSDPALAQKTLGSSRSLGLKLLAKPPVPNSQSVKVPAGVANSVRCLGNRHYAEVHPEPINCFALLKVGNIDGGKQKPITITIDKIGFAALKRQQFPLPLAANKRNSQPPVNAPNTDARSGHVPGQDASVVSYRSVFAKRAFAFFIKFVGVGHFSYQANHHLSGKREVRSKRFVERPVQRELPKLFSIPRPPAKPIARLVDRLNRAQQRSGLAGIGLQLYLDSQFHPKQLCFIYLKP